MNAHNREPSTDYYLLLLNGVNGHFIHHFGTNYLFLIPGSWFMVFIAKRVGSRSWEFRLIELLLLFRIIKERQRS